MSATRTLLVALVCVVLASCARAAPEDAQSATSSEPAASLSSELFSVKLVLAHQDELALTAAQSGTLRAELDRAHRDLRAIDVDLRAAKDALAADLRATPIDETAALARAARVTELEARIKQTHLRLLIRIKNLLDAEQRRKLTVWQQQEPR